LFNTEDNWSTSSNVCRIRATYPSSAAALSCSILISALTLFESTVLNAWNAAGQHDAGRIVAAVRLICNLHHRCFRALASASPQSASCRQLNSCNSQQQAAESRQHHSGRGQLLQRLPLTAGAGDGASPPSAKRPPKGAATRRKGMEQQHQQHSSAQTLGHVDSFASDAGGASSFPGDDEDDDCLPAGQEESSFSGGAGAVAAGAPATWMFGFEHPMNQMVAKKVIDQAQAVSGHCSQKR
uniref:CBFD_NFYB_HMF domain-containing protein n=1 Tax=Macrostomum lignano TaxID=282301 RepID=A0A1I8F655_9PLAT